MVRPYAVKGRKHKKRKMEQREEAVEEEVARGGEEEEEEVAAGNEKKVDAVLDELPGIPSVAPVEKSKQPNVIFILEKASLEIGKVGKNFQLLNSDDHGNFLRKQNLNPADYRPDIVHHALLAILDSPLTKAGRLQALYVRTEKGVLFEVKPNVRMPRTIKRFSGLMLQLLQKLSITTTGSHDKLLNVIKNPVTRYLPVNSRIIGLSYSSEKLVQLKDYVAAASDDATLVFVVGAMAHGKISNENTDDYISVSGYPLSAACCINRICTALEQKWKIL
ncbi:ribosomal RNA small subunit methyltransferase nep-1 [Dioscorea cayenensis subsp. rotundata]|uniref:Ribosomal RNA small subunit methyltransferase nep-1 n=1 Tax=Dioscorea cayennensis subsp. rotundata TaxID=55577 RepID=A0AB40B970_DIOCR|nr:ribosomal RNA small subunit methyltransferase nep-1 [Dioscorea cayenensis subsp. rotundata]